MAPTKCLKELHEISKIIAYNMRSNKKLVRDEETKYKLLHQKCSESIGKLFISSSQQI